MRLPNRHSSNANYAFEKAFKGFLKVDEEHDCCEVLGFGSLKDSPQGGARMWDVVEPPGRSGYLLSGSQDIHGFILFKIILLRVLQIIDVREIPLYIVICLGKISGLRDRHDVADFPLIRNLIAT